MKPLSPDMQTMVDAAPSPVNDEDTVWQDLAEWIKNTQTGGEGWYEFRIAVRRHADGSALLYFPELRELPEGGGAHRITDHADEADAIPARQSGAPEVDSSGVRQLIARYFAAYDDWRQAYRNGGAMSVQGGRDEDLQDAEAALRAVVKCLVDQG